ncbi:FliH/SctL family protein [Aquabacterium sp. A7-Y]|uniref:FliH/SctL family protein n=1 Tax=Aquabacterium sp. A7-Y TaxID=1349605 RepID=UPI00223CA848|nr:FliH/SctL family protein [Aquabacterium sp. A7-Y]MCW7540873.1 FliH/SctL family protein [Aquabacterium sp. A7-Y]
MDAVIRAVQLGPEKARLGQPRVTAASTLPGSAGLTTGAAGAARPAQPSAPDPATLRREAEAAVRRELADEAARLFEEERQRGRAEGRKEGLELGRKEAAAAEEALRQQALEEVRQVLQRIEAEQGKLLQGLQDDVGEIAFAAVCRILGEHAVTPAAVAGCVTQQLDALPHRGPLTVKLHPRDVQTLQPWLLSPEGARHALVLCADETLALGGCVIETGHGRHDASLETQLRRLKALLDAHRHSGAA